jgi:hypothetical protein
MKYISTRIGTLGTAGTTIGILAIGGVASACSMQGNNQSSYQGNRSYNSGWSNTSYRMSYNWDQWSPSTYSYDNGGSYSSWQSSMMNRMSSYQANWSSSSSNNNWMPSGNNWQQSWSNWNPMMWMNNGSSYSNWYNQFTSYMNSNGCNFQSEFNYY